MSDFLKKAGKGVGSLTGNAVKKAFSAIITEIAGEILKETGAMDIAKDKIMSAGFKVVKDMNLDVSSLKKDIIKKGILKELNIQ